ncbi:MAG: TetR/AcrR family transcriptional regulator [Aliivibrio sp.]|uniref:TetR/AcrR family transcriptional regulator n=1 Tax=Aliivibrio sp. TaxID=1872443 RepID=UPI001A50A02F|nr:TetR/AcrR family transcriptional regulator [Aliivibrio sp.]
MCMMDKRQRILDATKLLLSEHGFQGISMQLVAKKADVAAGTIYRYFSDKEDLIEQLRVETLIQAAKAIQKGVHNGLSLKERYRMMFLNVWNLASKDGNLLLNRNQYECLPKKDSCTFRELERSLFAQLEQLYSEGKKQGVFKPLDNEILVGLSLEVSITLARKHVQGLYQLDSRALEDAIDASWDAIILH